MVVVLEEAAMGESLGYALSAVVAGVIVLIIATLTFRGTEATVATIEFSSVKKSTIDLVAVMDRDFRNLGSNFPYPQMLSDLAVLNYDTVSTTKRFDFLAQTERGAPPDTISYRWTEGAPVESDGYSYPTVTVERYVNDQLTGGNSGVVTSFSIEPKTSTGDPVMVGNETRQIVVQLKMISSLGSHGEIRETRWSETYHSMHMGKHDGISL